MTRNSGYARVGAEAARGDSANNPRHDGVGVDTLPGESAHIARNEGAGAEATGAYRTDDGVAALQGEGTEDDRDPGENAGFPDKNLEQRFRQPSNQKMKIMPKSGTSELYVEQKPSRRPAKPASKPDNEKLADMLAQIFSLAVAENELGLGSIRAKTYGHVDERLKRHDDISKSVRERGLSAEDLIKNEYNNPTKGSDPDCHVAIFLDKTPQVKVGNLVQSLHNHPLETGTYNSTDLANQIVDGTVKNQWFGYDLRQRCVDLVKHAPHFWLGNAATDAILALMMEYEDIRSALNL
ncbi:uncharacterized protein BDZ99DRAFT_539138 [Mytilinidion resinicola]|uniref:Uncharacterized protein n=1 Tax=Mytilinidion resinicola TaxID=574789 RepID=A0A6A6YAN2_9PEZI|nr:uncharacterized protein BDZ99DRAFT_539138 [Mytilinidion resinicola]KAF2805882.1 hypothetical protein BDZ99DRAFT_539138 [Mytilinidion resinicola]